MGCFRLQISLQVHHVGSELIREANFSGQSRSWSALYLVCLFLIIEGSISQNTYVSYLLKTYLEKYSLYKPLAAASSTHLSGISILTFAPIMAFIYMSYHFILDSFWLTPKDIAKLAIECGGKVVSMNRKNVSRSFSWPTLFLTQNYVDNPYIHSNKRHILLVTGLINYIFFAYIYKQYLNDKGYVDTADLMFPNALSIITIIGYIINVVLNRFSDDLEDINPQELYQNIQPWINKFTKNSILMAGLGMFSVTAAAVAMISIVDTDKQHACRL